MLSKDSVSNTMKSNMVLSHGHGRWHLGDGRGQWEEKKSCFTSCVLTMAFSPALTAFVTQNVVLGAGIPVWHYMNGNPHPGWGSGLEEHLLLVPKHHPVSDCCISQLPQFWLTHNYPLSGLYCWCCDLNISTPKLIVKLNPRDEILREDLKEPWRNAKVCALS